MIDVERRTVLRVLRELRAERVVVYDKRQYEFGRRYVVGEPPDWNIERY
jgi:hypothetical protein